MPYYHKSIATNSSAAGWEFVQLPKNARLISINHYVWYNNDFYYEIIVRKGQRTATDLITPIIYSYRQEYDTAVAKAQHLDCNSLHRQLVEDGKITLQTYHEAGINATIQITIYYEVDS